jgi:1-phosphatidylinositol-3-phosphate 5-kinase
MSLASCIKWDSSGGKSGSAFLKTKGNRDSTQNIKEYYSNSSNIDDRLLMKQMSKYELDAFLGFAPAYFQYMSEAFFSELPTVLAKIFGFYSIGYKNPATGKSMRMDVLVMENLFYQRNVKKVKKKKSNLLVGRY